MLDRLWTVSRFAWTASFVVNGFILYAHNVVFFARSVKRIENLKHLMNFQLVWRNNTITEQSKQFLDRASGRLTVWNFYQSTSNPNTRTLKTAVTLIDLHKCPSYINCYLEVFLFVFHNLTSNKGRCLVSALVYGSSGLGSSPCAVLLGKTLYSHCVTLHQGV